MTESRGYCWHNKCVHTQGNSVGLQLRVRSRRLRPGTLQEGPWDGALSIIGAMGLHPAIVYFAS